MQRMLLKTMMALLVVNLFLHVEPVISEAIANTEKKEVTPTTTPPSSNVTSKDERHSSQEKYTTKPIIKLRGDQIHKLRRDSKVEGDRFKNFFHYVNSLNIQPNKKQLSGTQAKQVRINYHGDNKFKNMLMASLSNVKKFPKKLFDLKKYKGNGKQVLDVSKGKNPEVVLPRENNGIQAYRVNFNNDQRSSTKTPIQGHSIREHSGNFANQHQFRVSKDKSKEDHTVTDSGVHAFHIQNIGDKNAHLFTPVFDHSVPVALINHFEPDHLFAFQEPHFNSHSSSGELNFKSSQEQKDFKELNQQLFGGSSFITYDTLFRNNHGLLNSVESDSTSDHDLTNSKYPNSNEADSYKHLGQKFIRSFKNVNNNEQRHKNEYADNPELVIQNQYQTDTDYPGSVATFGHSSAQFTDSNESPVHDSSRYRHLNQKPVQFEYSHITPTSELSSAVDTRPHHSEHRPTYNLNENIQSIKTSEKIIDNYDFLNNLQNHNINSFIEPKIKQIHIYKFLSPSGSKDVSEITSFRIFPSSNENSDDTKYFSELSDLYSSSDPGFTSNTKYHHLKSTSDTFQPSEIKLIPFGPEDSMPDKNYKNHDSNNLDDHSHSISSFVPSEGARGALKINSKLRHHSGENSNTEDASRFHGDEGNNNLHYDDNVGILQNFPDSQYVDGPKLIYDEGKVILKNNEGYSFPKSSQFYSNNNHIFTEESNRPSSQLIEPLTIASFEDAYESNVGKPISERDHYTHSSKLHNNLNEENLEPNNENENNFSQFRSLQSTGEHIKPICYALPTSYIPYPPYAKSKFVCA